MGERELSEQNGDWTRAKEFIDSLGTTSSGKYMSAEPALDDVPHEEKMRDAKHASDSISKLKVAPTSPMGKALSRLEDSGMIDFTLEPYSIDAQPTADLLIQPKLEGSEVEQEREAKKFKPFWQTTMT